MSSEQIAEQDPLISVKEEEIVALKKQLEECGSLRDGQESSE